MKRQKAERRMQNAAVMVVSVISLFLLTFHVSHLTEVSAAEKWQGVDESVVEKFAKEHGREAKAPLINVEGDLQLFAFLLAGAAGGFAAGYYWRMITEKKSPKSKGSGK